MFKSIFGKIRAIDPEKVKKQSQSLNLSDVIFGNMHNQNYGLFNSESGLNSLKSTDLALNKIDKNTKKSKFFYSGWQDYL